MAAVAAVAHNLPWRQGSAGAAWVWHRPGPLTRSGTLAKSLDPDSSLIERCLSGEDSAWEALVRTHTRRVYGLCYRFTSRDSEAQDLTQEVFLRVFRTLKSFRAGEGSFVVWLSRLTRNLLIDHYRRSKQDRATDSIE